MAVFILLVCSSVVLHLSIKSGSNLATDASTATKVVAAIRFSTSLASDSFAKRKSSELFGAPSNVVFHLRRACVGLSQ